MFEISMILFGAKRWISNFFKAVFGSPYFWLATGLIVSLWLAWGWHTSTVEQAAKNATQAEYSRMVDLHEQAKAAAIDAEQRRAQTIIKANKERYETQLTDIQNRSARLLAEHRSGAVRLRVPVITTACAVSSSDTSGTQSDTGAIAAETRAELSDEAVRFFVGQAERADREAVAHNELVEIIEQLRSGKMGAGR